MLKFNQALHFLFRFYMYLGLVPSCLPTEDTLQNLINTPRRLCSVTVSLSTIHTETATVCGPPCPVLPRQNKMSQHFHSKRTRCKCFKKQTKSQIEQKHQKRGGAGDKPGREKNATCMPRHVLRTSADIHFRIPYITGPGGFLVSLEPGRCF